MTVTLIKSPDVTPISVTAVKTHLRLDHDFDDPYLQTLIETAVYYIQNDLHRSLMTQEWRLVWSRGEKTPSLLGQNLIQQDVSIELLYPPLQEILSIYGLRLNGPKKPIRRFVVDTSFEKPKVYLALRNPAFEICYRAGYGNTPEQVPAPIRQALLLLVSHFYANRSLEAVKSDALLQELLAPYRVKKLI